MPFQKFLFPLQIGMGEEELVHGLKAQALEMLFSGLYDVSPFLIVHLGLTQNTL